jgi:AcrR family transcriptional regulator
MNHTRDQDELESPVPARLLQAALEIFGEVGFEAASTRMVADRARTQLTAIAYYFRNKEGLYQAVAAYIGDSMSERLSTAAHQAALALADPNATTEQLIQSAVELLTSFLHLLIGPNIPDTWTLFLSREMFQPTSAYPMLHAAIQPFASALTGLIARLTNRRSDDSDVVLEMMTLVGQVLVFRSDRGAALAFLSRERYTSENINQLQVILERNTRAILQASLLNFALTSPGARTK